MNSSQLFTNSFFVIQLIRYFLTIGLVLVVKVLQQIDKLLTQQRHTDLVVRYATDLYVGISNFPHQHINREIANSTALTLTVFTSHPLRET